MSRWTGTLQAHARVEEQFRRWRSKEALVRHTFDEPEPVYQPQQREQQPHPLPPRVDVRVTSLRQAYEILGLPAGRITLQAARIAYWARIVEYHPDKVAHLGQKLRDLAARKALEINLAMQHLEAHCTS